MRSRKTLLALVVMCILAVSAVSACGGASEEPTEESVSIDGETLLEERCTQCHGLDTVTSAQMTRAEWDQTVTDMVNRGAQLNEEEQAVLVDYLAETYGP